MPNPLSTVLNDNNEKTVKSQDIFSITARANRTAEARQRYQEYLDRFPWGEHAPAALERLGGTWASLHLKLRRLRIFRILPPSSCSNG